MIANKNIIGIFATICTTIAFIPQVIKVIETQQTDGISAYMYIIFIIGKLLWFIYGILIGSNELIIANMIVLPMAIYILYYVINKSSNKY